MKKLIKFIFFLGGAVVIIAAIAITVFVMVVDPNDFKEEIAKVIDQKTGRQFEILGNIKWTIFPHLGISANDIRLGNPEGFGEPYFASLGAASVQLRLSSLLVGKIATSGVKIVDLSLSLERLENGKTNWKDFEPAPLQQSAFASPSLLYVSAETTKSTGEAPIAFNISDLTIINANVSFVDRQKNTESTISKFNGSSQNIQFNRPFLLKGEFDFHTSQLEGHTIFKGDVGISPTHADYSLHDFSISGKTQVPDKSIPAQDTLLTVDMEIDLEQDTLQISRCKGNLMGYPLEATLAVHSMTSTPVATGDFSLAGIQLGKFSATNISAKVNTQGEKILIQPMHADLYEGTFKGEATLTPQPPSPLLWESSGDLSELSLAALSRAFTGQEALGGTAKVHFSASGLADEADKALPALNGDASFTVSDGYLGGFDLNALFGSAGKAKEGESDAKEKGGSTLFDTMTGSFSIADAQVTNNDFQLSGKDYTASGKGTLRLLPANDYLASRLNYTLNATSPKLSKDLPLAVRIKGPLTQLSIAPDIEAYIQALLKKQLKEQLLDEVGLGGLFSGALSPTPPAEPEEAKEAAPSNMPASNDENSGHDELKDAFKEIENIFKDSIFGR